jgi:hypothetical protein
VAECADDSLCVDLYLYLLCLYVMCVCVCHVCVCRQLIECITPLIMTHQLARSKVTDDIVKTFMTPRKLAL